MSTRRSALSGASMAATHAAMRHHEAKNLDDHVRRLRARAPTGTTITTASLEGAYSIELRTPTGGYGFYSGR